ncbi:MAG: hypothetical protein HY934_05545 [Candidatus Firestonebacteria bacterium]|nr:hypothetical protein [Candidatus Firestonebacteria bacterium]
MTSRIDFIIGLPGETREDRKELYDFINTIAKSFNTQIHMHYFIPLTGTVFHFENPTPIDMETQKELDKMTDKGIISNWWKKDIKLSENVVNFRNFLHKCPQNLK